ncbi:MAG: O-methyltransferase [Aquiluna sp.]
MIDKITSWKFSEDFANEPAEIRAARRSANELGVESITEATGNQLAVLAGITKAKSIVEVGTGAGVSGLWLLSASSDSVLTTIDSEPEYQLAARENFKRAEIVPSRIRVISGKAQSVLANMAEAGYDLVFLDLNPVDLDQVLPLAVGLTRPGGALVLAHALWRDRVPNPTLRDEETSAIRSAMQKLADSEDFAVSISLVGDGLLIAHKR